ncbi:chlorophyll a/b-binding protein domain-containing protein [Pelagophyceae sp. CCMP2097]|nr:chlorophyll a/b-binding protein domain-containing protein [Pelagophyceae sp. CCMP2097]|mmetsp:Transcript_20331/g.68934  ORF Transcript_20331/g.68934 Transcript_20331/m.68934 type:complete len:262 (+) Transcript_20331:75-860(+)
MRLSYFFLASSASAYIAAPLARRGAALKAESELTPVDAANDADLGPALTTIPSRVKTRQRNVGPSLNGWVPKPYSFCYGLPGAIAPMGAFDPVGFSRNGVPLNDVRRYREAEVQHGRVAMVATVGYLVGEWASPVVWGGKISGPANDQLEQIPGPVLALLTLAIGMAETWRARRGWVEPGPGDLFELRATYYPGDIGFDPLGLKPAGAEEFATMQSKELSHGRLAMIGISGMVAQELINHKTLFETLAFYTNYANSQDPYL